MLIACSVPALNACTLNSKCRCGEEMVGGQEKPFCDLDDDDRIPEYKYL